MNNDKINNLIDKTIETVPQMTYEDTLQSQISIINSKTDSSLDMASKGLKNIDFLWAYLAFGGDSEKNKLKACENYIDLLHLLKYTPEQGIFRCQKCSSAFLGKRSGLCTNCKKERKKELRKKRESAAVYKAHRAADARYQNRLNKVNIEKERKDYIDFWYNEYEKFCDKWKNISETLSESEQIEWLEKQCRK